METQRQSPSRHWHYLHHLYGSPWHGEMRIVGKEGCSRLVRLCLYDRVTTNIVLDISCTARRDLLCLSNRRARVCKAVHVLLHPHLPLPVCTENLIRIDCGRESPNVGAQ